MRLSLVGRGLVVVVAALWAGIGTSSHAFEMRDRTIKFGMQWTYHERDLTGEDAPYDSDVSRSVAEIQAVAGRLVVLAPAEWCGETPERQYLSFVYASGRAMTGSLPTASKGCRAVATYHTQMTIRGNVITLSGKMNGTKTRSYTDDCGQYRGLEQIERSITQDISIRIQDNACEVISSKETVTETVKDLTEYKDGSRRENRKVKITRRTSGPSDICRVEIRSEKPPPGPSELKCFKPSC